MLKKYSAWTGIISFIMITVLAIVKLVTGMPQDGVFVLSEWLLYVIFFVSGCICIKEAIK